MARIPLPNHSAAPASQPLGGSRLSGEYIQQQAAARGAIGVGLMHMGQAFSQAAQVEKEESDRVNAALATQAATEMQFKAQEFVAGAAERSKSVTDGNYQKWQDEESKQLENLVTKSAPATLAGRAKEHFELSSLRIRNNATLELQQVRRVAAAHYVQEKFKANEKDFVESASRWEMQVAAGDPKQMEIARNDFRKSYGEFLTASRSDNAISDVQKATFEKDFDKNVSLLSAPAFVEKNPIAAEKIFEEENQWKKMFPGLKEPDAKRFHREANIEKHRVWANNGEKVLSLIVTDKLEDADRLNESLFKLGQMPAKHYQDFKDSIRSTKNSTPEKQKENLEYARGMILAFDPELSGVEGFNAQIAVAQAIARNKGNHYVLKEMEDIWKQQKDKTFVLQRVQVRDIASRVRELHKTGNLLPTPYKTTVTKYDVSSNGKKQAIGSESQIDKVLEQKSFERQTKLLDALFKFATSKEGREATEVQLGDFLTKQLSFFIAEDAANSLKINGH